MSVREKDRSRTWCFTINHYSAETEDDLDTVIEKLVGLGSVHMVIGKETGDSGTPHLQGFVRFKNQKTFSSMKKLLPRAHIESCFSEVGSIQYCKKGGDFFELGQKTEPGKRNDLEQVKQAYKAGKTLGEIVDAAESFQAIQLAQKLAPYFEPKRSWKTEVKWFFGPSGTGKTRLAYEILGQDVYEIDGAKMKWWDGYCGQSNVIIDDIRQDGIEFASLIKLIDRYPYRVEFKGGSCQFLAKRIIITCPVHPKVEFGGGFISNDNSGDSIIQLLRRIDEIVDFGSPAGKEYYKSIMNEDPPKPAQESDSGSQKKGYKTPRLK